MKSILFIFPTSDLGGAERIMFNLIKYLTSIDFDVYLFVLSSNRNSALDQLIMRENLKIIYCNSSSDKSILSYLKLYEYIRKSFFDYIFTSHIITNSLVSLFLKMLKIDSKLISRESTTPFNRFSGIKIIIIKMMYKFFYGKQSLLIYQTKFMKDSLYDNLGFYPVNRNIIIGNCVDVFDIKLQIKNSNLIRNDTFLTIVACGRLIDLKQFDILLKAYSRLIENYDGKSRLFIIGDGPEKDKMIKLSIDLDLMDNVIFTGMINNPSAYFSIADIGVVSSLVEGFPNVILEMMASGIKQVISTPCTPAIYDIPNVIITNGFNSIDLYKSLHEAAIINSDSSCLYRNYIYSNCTISSFWKTIIDVID